MAETWFHAGALVTPPVAIGASRPVTKQPEPPEPEKDLAPQLLKLAQAVDAAEAKPSTKVDVAAPAKISELSQAEIGKLSQAERPSDADDVLKGKLEEKLEQSKPMEPPVVPSKKK